MARAGLRRPPGLKLLDTSCSFPTPLLCVEENEFEVLAGLSEEPSLRSPMTRTMLRMARSTRSSYTAISGYLHGEGPTPIDDADFHNFVDGLFVVARAKGLSVVCLGDWNLEPEEHPGITAERHLWALPDSEDFDFFAPARWDGQRAVDYGFGTADAQGRPQTFWEEVFSDHKGVDFEFWIHTRTQSAC